MNKYGILGAIAAAALATSAVAQSPAPTTPSTDTPAVVAPTTPPVTAPSATTTTTTPAAGASAVLLRMEPGQVRTSKLIGANVYNPADEKIGEVNDLVVDSGGKVVGVVIGVGGFLGIGEKDVAVSYPSVTVTKDDRGNEKVSVSMTKEQLKDAAPYQTALNKG